MNYFDVFFISYIKEILEIKNFLSFLLATPGYSMK